MSLRDYLNASSCENKTLDKYNEECLNNNYLNLNNGTYWTYTREYNKIEATEEIEEENTEEEIIEDESIEPTNNMIYSVSSTINTNNINDILKIVDFVNNKDFNAIYKPDSTTSSSS